MMECPSFCWVLLPAAAVELRLAVVIGSFP